VSNTIELKETPLSPEDIKRDYIDINQVAEILNDVSTKTAYSYMAKALKEHSVRVKAIDVVSNGVAKKLYKRSDIIEVAKILNKDKTVIHYETVIIRPDVTTTPSKNGITEALKGEVLEANSKSFQDFPRLSNTNLYRLVFGTQLIGLLISISLALAGFYLIKEFHHQSRQIASLKAEIRHYQRRFFEV